MLAKRELHWADYVIFVLMLLVSIGIGIYHSVRGGMTKNMDEYLMGSRQMGLVPVSLSLIASYVSAILILGFPAEMYAYGGQFWLYCVGTSLGAVLAALIFVPLLYPLQLTSVNEYLESRYKHRVVKWIGTFCSVVALVFLTGVTYFGPATALEAVTDIPVWGYILLMSGVTMTYTTLGSFRGGYKGVIWTDVFQCFVMVGGMIAIAVAGVLKVGDINRVWDINREWGRLNIVDIDPNPLKRVNFWGVTIGTGLTFMGIYGTTQMGVQRFASLPSIKKARIAVLSVIPGTALLSCLACLAGVVVFAYYTNLGCDPIRSRQIKNPNQIVPYFVLEVLGYPAIPGIFLACICAGSLSTASSALNSAAANMWKDVLEDLLPKVDERRANYITKALVIIFGIIATAMSLGIMSGKGPITQAVNTFNSSLGGPLVALFLMGAFVPYVNWKGACVGSLLGFVFALWIGFGSFLLKRKHPVLATPVYNCSNICTTAGTDDMLDANATWLAGTTSGLLTSTLTSISNAVTSLNETIASPRGCISLPPGPPPVHEPEGLDRLYSLSFLWFKETSSGITILFTIIFSFITGATDPKSIQPRLLHPLTRKILRHYGKLGEEDDDTQGETKLAKENLAYQSDHNLTSNNRQDVSTVSNGHLYPNSNGASYHNGIHSTSL